MYRVKTMDLDGTGGRRVRVYDLPPGPLVPTANVRRDYWAAVTNVPCPCCQVGVIRKAEAGYVPGYRICDGCGRHFQAAGDSEAPTLILNTLLGRW